jgi:hypothetical protein
MCCRFSLQTLSPVNSQGSSRTITLVTISGFRLTALNPFFFPLNSGLAVEVQEGVGHSLDR